MFGVIAFILTLLFLVLVHEWGHFFSARRLGVKVEEFGFGFPPQIAKKHWRGVDYTFNWLPFGGFVRLKGEESEDRSPDSFSVQSAWKRSVIVLAGVFMNLVVAVVLFSVVAGMGVRQDITTGVDDSAQVSNVSHLVVAVVPNGPSAEILKPGDEIIQVDGQEFTTLSNLQNYLQTESGSVELLLNRDSGEEKVEVTPSVFSVAESSEQFRGIGVQLQSVGDVKYSWWLAPIEGIKMTWEIFSLIATTVWDAIVGLFSSEKTASPLEVTGPVGIAVLTGDVVKLGATIFLQFVAILSVNLAFLNLLPIPALDGGRFAFLLFEMITRRPVSERIELSLHRIGFSLLLLLVIVVTIIDVGRFSGGITNFFQNIF